MKNDLRKAIMEQPYWYNSEYYDRSFRDFNYQTYQADQIRQAI